MAIYDRDWYRNEDKAFSYTENNKKISPEAAEKLRKLFEGIDKSEKQFPDMPNEPPKVDPKYKHDFIGKQTEKDEDVERKVDEFINNIGNKQQSKRKHKRPLKFMALQTKWWKEKGLIYPSERGLRF